MLMSIVLVGAYLVNPSVYCALSWVSLIGAFGASFLGCLVVPFCGVYAYPEARSSHSYPTPLGGGLAILVGMTVGLLIFLTVANDVRILAIGIPHVNNLIELLILSAGICVMGWLDDCYSLSWKMRLVFQFCMASFFIYHNPVPFMENLYIPGLGLLETHNMRSILGVLWIVCSTNGFNFIDGLNGLSSGVMLILLFGILILLGDKSYVYSPILFILMGSIGGFYIFNFPQARVFMGDAGSQMLGFFISGLALLIPSSTGGEVPLLTVPLLLWPCINDVINTFIRRLVMRRRIQDSHRDYLFHILTKIGFSHIKVVLIYYFFMVHQIGAAWIMSFLPYTQHLFVFIPSIVLFIIYACIIMGAAQRRSICL
ncbi:MAG: undecaprenyl/decaprenyl-phosphate alpha-N-acetylglucosaminyl 1-phosphate transferase [Alphaproteobacteria bacterium]|nr:MAG: undecaprenyl/decaprenyl-phosphate alpha-N-acetylglucosaminyl 1-phosphate transferase [Alphaproteobacteria bacterium]